jgi:hypothetical protein
MAESFFDLSSGDRADALEVAAGQAGRPAELLEKDIWVVWTLDTLFRASFGDALTFKGGTSLSKAYRAIDRFSEDVDLTYDIRELLPEFADVDGDPVPASRSQADRITARVRRTLPDWVGREPRAVLLEGAARAGLTGVEVRAEGANLILVYPHCVPLASEYVRAEVLVEFGARSSGEPADVRKVTCDAEPYLVGVIFPIAHPRTMAVERTFWEKATAVHVYCLQKRLRSARFARHWYDLAQLEAVGLAEEALGNREVALQVAGHKTWFFRERSVDGRVISYPAAVEGNLVLIPEGEARLRLADDYGRMLSSGLLPPEAPSFDEVLAVCRTVQDRANR